MIDLDDGQSLRPPELTICVETCNGETEGDISALIDTLANRVGHQRLYRFAPVESDVPERLVQRIAPLAPDTGARTDPWPHPTRLLPVPEPIETVALLPDHPPVTFTWRGVRHRVNRADGPERIFGEWWKHDGEAAAMCDYFQVENDAGERFWISIAQATARTARRDRIAGSCMGFSDEWLTGMQASRPH